MNIAMTPTSNGSPFKRQSKLIEMRIHHSTHLQRQFVRINLIVNDGEKSGLLPEALDDGVTSRPVPTTDLFDDASIAAAAADSVRGAAQGFAIDACGAVSPAVGRNRRRPSSGELCDAYLHRYPSLKLRLRKRDSLRGLFTHSICVVTDIFICPKQLHRANFTTSIPLFQWIVAVAMAFTATYVSNCNNNLTSSTIINVVGDASAAPSQLISPRCDGYPNASARATSSGFQDAAKNSGGIADVYSLSRTSRFGLPSWYFSVQPDGVSLSARRLIVTGLGLPLP